MAQIARFASAGRVQSVALRLICEREIEIEKFNAREYWTVDTDFLTPENKMLPSRLTVLNGEKLDKFSLANEAQAHAAEAAINAASFSVENVESKPGQRNPSPPLQPRPCNKKPHASWATLPVVRCK